MSPTEAIGNVVRRPWVATWVTAVVAVAALLVQQVRLSNAEMAAEAVIKAEVRANTQHRQAWRHIDPQKIRSLPETLSRLTVEIASLRRELERARDTIEESE